MKTILLLTHCILEFKLTYTKKKYFSSLTFFKKRWCVNLCFAQEVLTTIKPLKCHGNEEKIGDNETTCVLKPLLNCTILSQIPKILILRWDGAGHSISPPTHHLPIELETHLGEDFSSCTTLINSKSAFLCFSLFSFRYCIREMFWVVSVWMWLYVLVAQSCPTLCHPWTVVHQAPLAWGPGKNTGVGCVALLQGFFLTQGSNPGLWHCRQILYHLSYLGSPNVIRGGQKIMLNPRVSLGLGFESFVKY